MKKMSKGKKIAVSVAGALALAAVGVYFVKWLGGSLAWLQM